MCVCVCVFYATPVDSSSSLSSSSQPTVTDVISLINTTQPPSLNENLIIPDPVFGAAGFSLLNQMTALVVGGAFASLGTPFSGASLSSNAYLVDLSSQTGWRRIGSYFDQVVLAAGASLPQEGIGIITGGYTIAYVWRSECVFVVCVCVCVCATQY